MRRRAHSHSRTESVRFPGVKISQSADVDLGPIFTKIGFHFTASFDPQMSTLNVVVSAKLFQFIVSSLLAVVQVVCFGPLNAAANAGPLTNEMRQKLVTMMTKEYEYMIGSNDGTSEGKRPTCVSRRNTSFTRAPRR